MPGKSHPLTIPLLLSLCLLAGTGWAAWTGAPGYGGALLVLLPVGIFALQVCLSLRSRQRPSPGD